MSDMKNLVKPAAMGCSLLRERLEGSASALVPESSSRSSTAQQSSATQQSSNGAGENSGTYSWFVNNDGNQSSSEKKAASKKLTEELITNMFREKLLSQLRELRAKMVAPGTTANSTNEPGTTVKCKLTKAEKKQQRKNAQRNRKSNQDANRQINGQINRQMNETNGRYVNKNTANIEKAKKNESYAHKENTVSQYTRNLVRKHCSAEEYVNSELRPQIASSISGALGVMFGRIRILIIRLY